MSDDLNDLDSFLAPEEDKPSLSQKETKQENSDTTQDNIDLEDEFSKLLNDFIAQDMGINKAISNKTTPPQKQEKEVSLDNMLAPNEEEQELEDEESLDNIDDETPQAEETDGGLDGFASENVNEPDGGLDGFASENVNESGGGLDSFASENVNDTEQNEESFGGLDDLITSDSELENQDNTKELKDDEHELARAIENFQDGISAMASKKNLKLPKFDYDRTMLIPNYKPSIGKKIAQYLLDCWTIINKYDPQNMKKLSPTATDEEYLTFAENLEDTYMQLAIISYVEILMNMEICENTYQQRKEEMQKRRIKRELYEEYMELQERKQMFIEKLKEKNFPIDAKNLINNYFRAAQKDPDGSFEALTKNPAMFSPIQVEKIPPKFFGLIKVTPEDGIKVNQKIGKFIKNLKV